jgi:2-keto-4-pentenoate hydratase/2-oxohepta-3-ene-1,7-dioic acid hydratase in catechol pathway
VDYEGEIGVVIGKRCENISADVAWDYVAGLTPVNDVSARDMIHDVAKIIASISSKEPLLPGDILCAGTPDGVDIATEKFLRTGDVVEIQISDWPVLRNRIA